MRMHRRPAQLLLVAAVVMLAMVASACALQTGRGTPAATTRYTRVADLEDGPSAFQQKQQQKGPDWMGGRRAHPEFTDEDRARHLAAARAAREYATQYVSHFQQSHPSDAKTATRPPTKHASSGYDKISRVQEKERQKKQQQQQQPQGGNQQQEFAFADSGASFVEESVKIQGPFPKQDWTYSDTESPPPWLVPEADAKQGVPTTKPPPVPRMPPPPPPTPTPTWMSPFDQHQTPVFPQSSTPAPFYGMGPPPQQPPANYLPLDTFMSPAPEEGA